MSFIHYRLSTSKILGLFLLLLAFIGQTMAATAVPCGEMNNMPAHMQMMTVVMSDADSSTLNGEMDDNMDCCQIDCHCPMGMCIAATLSSFINTETSLAKPSKINHYSMLLNSQLPSSLYRPPII